MRQTSPRTEARGSTLKRAPQERGSALLIVFVFAAMIAIMLYMEMPVAAFEAKRQKEQLLVDRGNEYVHAIKLFVRKTGTYPASLNALENTNNMRFLRHRFVDPFTGKDDWRLLHAGPGGMLIDSKVNPLNANGKDTKGKNGSQTDNSFSNSNTMSSTASDAEQTVVKNVPQRPPAISAGGAGSTQAASPAGADQDPNAPLLPPGKAEELTNNSPPAVDAQAGQQAQPQANGSATASSANDMMRNLASNPNPQTSRGNTSMSGRMMSGGIAGVASNAKGPSIKEINDQTDYSRWEFYYDPTKDLAPGMNGAMQMGARQSGTTNQSGFGSNSSSQSSTNPTSSAGSTPTAPAAGATPSNPQQ